MTTAVLDKLTRRQAEVIHWRYIVGVRTDEQIAEHIGGITRSAVTHRRLRALRRLRNDDNSRELLESAQKRHTKREEG